MKKKFISILLAAALVAGLLCAPALAEGETGTGVFVAGIELEVDREYTNADFWPLVDAPDPTPDPDPSPSDAPSASPSADPSAPPGADLSPAPSPAAAGPAVDASAVYGGMTRGADGSDWNAELKGDAANGYTLYIKDLSVMGNNTNEGAVICSSHDLTIVLEGVNSAIGADSSDEGVRGILVQGQLVIKGDGTLTVTAGNTNDGSSYGIFAADVKITDGATVIATGGSAGSRSAGIRGETVKITDDATVIATGGSATGSYGICAYEQEVIDITSSTVVARAGTADGAFGSNRWALDGTVTLNGAKLAGAVTSGTEDTTPTVEEIGDYTSLAIVPTAWTGNALPEAEDDNTYNIADDTYVVSADARALDIKSDATMNVDEGKTLLAVSLFEDMADTAGIRSTASVTLSGNVIAVGGLTTVRAGEGSSSGFAAEGGTVTIDGSLLAVGAGTCGYGYSSGGDTTVRGTLTCVGVGVSGTRTQGLNLQGDLTVESGGAVAGYAGPVSGDELSTAEGIYANGKKIIVKGSLTGVGAIHGSRGADPVNGGAYFGKTAAVSNVGLAEGSAFYDEKGNVPADLAAEQYLTVGLKKYDVFFHMGGDFGDLVLAIENIPHNSTALDGLEEMQPGAKIEDVFATERDGYTFGGWYTSIDGGMTLSAARYDFNTPVTAEVHLYPKWTRPSSRGGSSAAPAKATCPQDHTCPIAAFEDADPKGWYHDGVHYCIEQELMIGTGETEFAPHGATSRAMIVTILHRLAGAPEAATTGTFTDVADGLWYSEAIEWAAAKGIVEGNGAGVFEPEADLTREQAATILYRYIQHLGGGFTGAWAFRLDFADLGEMSEWANEGVSWCVMNGLLEGDDKGLLRPVDGLERCEMATLIYRLCEKILK